MTMTEMRLRRSEGIPAALSVSPRRSREIEQGA